MRGLLRNPIGLLVVAGLACGLGGCGGGGLVDMPTLNPLPRIDSFARPDWLSYSGGKEDFTLRPVTANDLVTAEGRCASAAPPPSGDDPAGAEPGVPLLAGGIALQMTECDVVLRIGHPEQLEFGTGGRGERTVVITYLRGNRPGVYRFTGGRLVSIERPPGPPPSERQPKGKAKKART